MPSKGVKPVVFRVGALRRRGEHGRAAYWWCPRCQRVHMANLDTPDRNGMMWHWNGSYDYPTLTPAVIFRTYDGVSGDTDICHSVITKGTVRYTEGTTTREGQTMNHGRAMPLPMFPPGFTGGLAISSQSDAVNDRRVTGDVLQPPLDKGGSM